jgi:hypothetical protein
MLGSLGSREKTSHVPNEVRLFLLTRVMSLCIALIRANGRAQGKVIIRFF